MNKNDIITACTIIISSGVIVFNTIHINNMKKAEENRADLIEKYSESDPYFWIEKVNEADRELIDAKIESRKNKQENSCNCNCSK